MRVEGVERMYAVGDCVNFSGPKLGHMAVLQAEVAAANVLLELEGLEAIPAYDHEMMLVIDEGGEEAIYLHKHLWDAGPAKVKHGRSGVGPNEFTKDIRWTATHRASR